MVLALSLLDDADLARVRLRVPAPPTAAMTQPKVVAAWVFAALPIAASLAWSLGNDAATVLPIRKFPGGM